MLIRLDHHRESRESDATIRLAPDAASALALPGYVHPECEIRPGLMILYEKRSRQKRPTSRYDGIRPPAYLLAALFRRQGRIAGNRL